MDDLAKQLIDLQTEDQANIRQADFCKLSAKHVAVLKEIIGKIGWPTISKVGKEASFSAWLIAQHADYDPVFQEYCLDQMLAVKNDIEKKNIAYLSDRILVHQNKSQLYGTQFYTDEHGIFGPRPIDDPDQIEARWTKMEMAGDEWKTFAEYKEYMEKKYGHRN